MIRYDAWNWVSYLFWGHLVYILIILIIWMSPELMICSMSPCFLWYWRDELLWRGLSPHPGSRERWRDHTSGSSDTSRTGSRTWWRSCWGPWPAPPDEAEPIISNALSDWFSEESISGLRYNCDRQSSMKKRGRPGFDAGCETMDACRVCYSTRKTLITLKSKC